MAVVLAARGAVAESAPLQLSLVPGIALCDRYETIEGLTLGLWSENPQSAFALGIVNGSSGQSAGLSLGIFLNYANDYTGVALAPFNYVNGDFCGWQGGLVNYTERFMRGVQIGVANYAGHLMGVQIGLVNHAATARSGLQISAASLFYEDRWHTGFPDEPAPEAALISWRF